MQTQYDYAKDNRTDAEYEAKTLIGQHNQAIAIEQYRIDRTIQRKPNIRVFVIPDKEFQRQDGSWGYNSDYIFEIDDIQYPVEVKVQMAKLTDTIDLKLNQLKYLAKNNGYILYATPKRYFIHSAQFLMDNGSIIKSKRFKDKPVCQINVINLNWEYWLHKPDFVSYV